MYGYIGEKESKDILGDEKLQMDNVISHTHFCERQAKDLWIRGQTLIYSQSILKVLIPHIPVSSPMDITGKAKGDFMCRKVCPTGEELKKVTLRASIG